MNYVNLDGLWWPEEEPQKDIEHATARLDAIDAAMPFMKGTSFCLQAGGWVGIWPLYLSDLFDRVVTFEPVPYLFECMKKNIENASSNSVQTPRSEMITAYDVALGPALGELTLEVARSGCTSACLPTDPKSRSRYVETIKVPVTTIDETCEKIERVDALFLDVERYEIPVLRGALYTIRKHKPVITVEVLKGGGPKIIEAMDDLKYRLVARAHNDWIFAP